MFRRSLSSDDSELSESLNSKSAIRVSVCLQRYFKDVRARCYILAVRNRRVRWLEKRLQKIFALPGSFCLCTNGHLLPSSEPLAVLNPEDSIEVIPLLEDGTGLLQNTDSSNLYVENQTQNEEKASIESLTHNSISQANDILNHNHITSNEDYCDVGTNQERDLPKEDVSLSMPENIDDYDGIGMSSACFTVNNNNFTQPGDVTNSEDTIDTAVSLQQLKRRALALLDASGEPDEPPPRRARRRVRRRARRPPVAELPPECAPPSTARAEAPSPRSEVARNEAACSRKPRVVKSLEVDD